MASYNAITRRQLQSSCHSLHIVCLIISGGMIRQLQTLNLLDNQPCKERIFTSWLCSENPSIGSRNTSNTTHRIDAKDL
jgi:hypothetical protein